MFNIIHTALVPDAVFLLHRRRDERTYQAGNILNMYVAPDIQPVAQLEAMSKLQCCLHHLRGLDTSLIHWASTGAIDERS